MAHVIMNNRCAVCSQPILNGDEVTTIRSGTASTSTTPSYGGALPDGKIGISYPRGNSNNRAYYSIVHTKCMMDWGI